MNHMMAARVRRKHELKPHWIERYMASDDPDFEKKTADFIGLYLKPSAHPSVFCVDEKTAIQAPDRKAPFCRSHRVGLNDTGRCRNMPPSMRRPARC
ncbi:MAG: hypothetical protein ACYDDO_00725 [Acidiferrobacterales bacterium]